MDTGETDLNLLANAGSPPVTFAADDVIFGEGDPGDKMYVVRSGEVQIEQDGIVVETLGQDGIFGEMALIDGMPRSATARAKTEAELIPITERTFLFLVHETPFFALAVMRTLAERLRRSRS